jgi:hypothetical protein
MEKEAKYKWMKSLSGIGTSGNHTAKVEDNPPGSKSTEDF